jgi:superfamily II DNA or RNA helicase
MTTHSLRPYQTDLKNGVYRQWQHVRNVLAVAPTGAGKTVLFANILSENPGASVAIAHRSELVGQMSLALAREGVRHRVIGAQALQRQCVANHMGEMGRSYVEPNAAVAVASVDTLIRMSVADPWFQQVTLWIQDEAHHVLADNKWGDACKMFPNARGLGVTATPVRADGKGLGRHADGLFDVMVEGPSMRELINAGYLTDYRIFAPPSDLDLTDVTVSASGDYSPPKLKAARRKSRITGDVVAHYLRIAPHKRGVTFDTDIESATETARAYREAGVIAEIVSSETPDALRQQILRRFRAGEIHQLVNVDLFGEGFDLPAIEVVSMARPTQSYALFAQQFGRALRLLEGKDRAIIIDHVGNVERHGLPDKPRVWSLNRRERRAKGAATDVIPTRTCMAPIGPDLYCSVLYERTYDCCPVCGTPAPPPASRGAPEFVDGVLDELDPAVLARMRGESQRIMDAPRFPTGASDATVGAIKRVHWERQQAQAQLRSLISLWGGWQQHLGRDMREAQKRFFFKFGVDVETARALNAADAGELERRIEEDLARNNVVAA